DTPASITPAAGTTVTPAAQSAAQPTTRTKASPSRATSSRAVGKKSGAQPAKRRARPTRIDPNATIDPFGPHGR
ncbi:MAG: hypothetical protein K8M05_31935, partial [Deltaproteobacteria bacterium]|nr:hypothetical protein [Kofleriaceae bacterium]